MYLEDRKWFDSAAAMSWRSDTYRCSTGSRDVATGTQSVIQVLWLTRLGNWVLQQGNPMFPEQYQTQILTDLEAADWLLGQNHHIDTVPIGKRDIIAEHMQSAEV